jgi:trk system potassium uptake protein TrkA
VVELVAAQRSPITRKPLSRLDSFFHDQLLIGAYFREGKWQIAVGDTQIRGDEPVIVVCGSRRLKDVRKLFLA